MLSTHSVGHLVIWMEHPSCLLIRIYQRLMFSYQYFKKLFYNICYSSPYPHQIHHPPSVAPVPTCCCCAHTCTTMTHQGSNAPLYSPCGPQGEDRPSGKAGSAHPSGENGKAGPSPDTSSQSLPNYSLSLHKAQEKRKQKKINIDEAEGKDGKHASSVFSFFSCVAVISLTFFLSAVLQKQHQNAFKAS